MFLVSCQKATPNDSPAVQVPVPDSSEAPVYLSEVTIGGSEYDFAPNKIYVKPGSSISITFKNQGLSFHNFVIPDLGITTKTLASNESEKIVITPEKEGTYQIICSIAGHKEAGMVGFLIVK